MQFNQKPKQDHVTEIYKPKSNAYELLVQDIKGRKTHGQNM